VSDIDAVGCLRSLRAHLALDGVSWVRSGSVEIAVGQGPQLARPVAVWLCPDTAFCVQGTRGIPATQQAGVVGRVIQDKMPFDRFQFVLNQ
jgi:hypothetical protein